MTLAWGTWAKAVANPSLEASPTRPRLGARRVVADREAIGPVLLALAIPFLFLHERYQPDLSIGVSSTCRLSPASILCRFKSSGFT